MVGREQEWREFTFFKLFFFFKCFWFFSSVCVCVHVCARPQVKAAKLGHILVIDEADKAPTNVTSILKTLVESGEMILADGRRIISGTIQVKARLSQLTVTTLHRVAQL